MKNTDPESITLITAFFDISRKDYKTAPRTNNQYFSYFEFWAGMQNPLIIYTSPEFADRAMEIRAKKGRAEQTKVVVIDDITMLEPETLAKMKAIQEQGQFVQSRVLPNAPSGVPLYSYVMLLKSYFLRDAVERFQIENEIAWIDFGFNHGNDLYVKPEEFEFEWRHDFGDKINFFVLRPYDGLPWFDVVLSLRDYATGGIIALPAKRAAEFHALLMEQMNALLAVGLYDDDQTLLLMASQKHPDAFNVSRCRWNEQFILTSDRQFTVKQTMRSGIKAKLRNIVLAVKLGHRRRTAIHAYLSRRKKLLRKIFLR